MIYRSSSSKVSVSVLLFVVLFSGSALSLVAPVNVGNPSMAQFPDNSSYKDQVARSVWDMHYYDGRIYIGSGDLWANRGPINIWSLGPDGGFINEYTVSEEQVCTFRDYDGKLLVPGADSTESWDYGNLYVKHNGLWEKLRTIPNGVHVWDVAVFKGNLYVQIMADTGLQVLESDDMGQTWNPLIATQFGDKTFLGNIVALDNYLIIKGKPSRGRPCIYVYDGNTIQTMSIPTKVGRIEVASSRFVRFMDGILCAPSPVDEYMQGCIGRSVFPTFFMNGFGNPRGPDVTIIREFQRKLVRDIIVRNNTCYILTSSKEDNGHTGRIYSSSDLYSWVMLAEFPVPTSPYSFELMGGAFYVGLGYGFCMDDGDIESGNVYKIDPSGSPQVTAQAPPQPLRWDAAQGWQDGTAAVLYQNQPNPFNPETWIPYELREDADVAIKIYEATGMLIRTLNLGRKSTGRYTDNGKAAYWDGKNEAGEQVASGIYFYNMQAGEFSATKKMLVVR